MRLGEKGFRTFGRGSAAGLLLASVAIGGLALPSVSTAQTVNVPVRSFNIPTQPLGEALADFGQQSGLQVSVDATKVRGLSSGGVSGTMPPAQALDRLLTGSGFSGRIEGRVVTLQKLPQTTDGAVQVGPLQVEGAVEVASAGAERDARDRDAVYDLDLSSTYMGKEEVERYKGVNPADVLKGMVNVFSGDARNSGAIDPSIRGTQGPGRVPVIIDGTEQALTVWRGYNGASNRSYIDPSLIAGVQVLKGPVSTRDVNGSTGGAVVINTLDADDILQPSQTFGFELKLEGGNNSTAPRLPTLLTGQDYRTVPGFPGSPRTPGYPTSPFADPSLRVKLRTGGDNDFLSMGDRAARLAVAGRIGDIDLFGAYAWRKRGNYFSGENGAGYYARDDLPRSSATYIQRMALHYEPGNEVPNTSSETRSWLFKGTWHVADDQYLQLGFRDSKSTYGEIMPSRIIATDDFGAVQWPLSKVHAQAYNAEYKWQPDSQWIDLKANLWATRTASHTYSAGGFPNFASFDDPTLRNNAIANARNNRIGFTASNQMKLTSRFDLLLEGNWSHEKLSSSDTWDGTFDGWRQYPRAGRREEYRISLKGEWRPASFLKFNAGLTYSGYWAVDDFLRRQIAAGNADRFTTYVPTDYTVAYKTEEFGVDAYRAQQLAFWQGAGFPSDLAEMLAEMDAQAYAANPFPFTVDHQSTWAPDAQGRYRRADNICANGSLGTLSNYVSGSCVALANQQPFMPSEAKRKSGHGWAPMVSATAYLSGSSRIYLRFAEAYRFPSMFESTIGFSASLNPLADLKPEHVHSYEAAFIQDLRDLFGLEAADQRADLKLSWYRNVTRNVIERTTRLMFSNIDRQTIAGLELQAPYDNGQFFTELGTGHMLTNKVCDESVAVQIDIGSGRVPDCVKYGFVSGYLLTQATPEDTINWTLGGRFLEKRLELGGRLTWYSKYKNREFATFINDDNGLRGVLNIPYAWGETLTLDAYVTFRLNERFSAELVGTNLTDKYYADPLTRALNPAPGRTVRLSLTGRF